MYAASPRTHPPSFLPCSASRISCHPRRRGAARSQHTNQDPYHNYGTLTGVTAITQTVLPIFPFRWFRKRDPATARRATHQINQLLTAHPPTGIRTHLSHRTR
jgi:hypothetical protein